jgi:hypothetical protein
MSSCPECRRQFEPRRHDQSFCSAKCNAAANYREQVRSRRIYRALYWWRYERGGFGENMRFVCREIAAWIREDREAQRLPPPKHDHNSNRGHERPPARIRLKKAA